MWTDIFIHVDGHIYYTCGLTFIHVDKYLSMWMAILICLDRHSYQCGFGWTYRI
jgi:hypothetical protein